MRKLSLREEIFFCVIVGAVEIAMILWMGAAFITLGWFDAYLIGLIIGFIFYPFASLVSNIRSILRKAREEESA